ncbi:MULTISPECIES: fimbria/pilus outer membrane usher protein [unclassified Acidovorax]|uniref:fimbria/pilus outer membrane usher protein n=1 Tax=unclassified Acidovorax TaxID=2684926 RepID=UPI0028832374|nr:MULTISPECIES: fimbria/pilus outer membrane usher protein [unclassified Acidovorax]
MQRNDRPTSVTRAGRWLVLAACLPHWLGAGALPALPPAPPAGAGLAGHGPITLYLEVIVNGQRNGEVVEVTQHGPDHHAIDAAMLRQLYIHTDQPAGTRVAVESLPGVSARYDGPNQRLAVQVPPAWLPAQSLQPEEREPLQLSAGSGWLLNYDVYAQRSQGRPSTTTSTAVWSEQRYFGPLGIASHSGLYRRTDGGGQSGYLRYDTRWTRTDPVTATEVTVGDMVTGALPWSTSVRLGGVQWSRNFATRPDLVTYPLPEFAGQAAVPSAVDVFVNGFRSTSQNVAPGPFTLGGLPTVSGSGVASIVTTDALGRRVSTDVPFYVSSQLLRPGWTDYSLSLGALRRDFGMRNLAYGQTLGSGVYRRGMSDRWTLEGQAQAGRDLAVLGVGTMNRLGQWGVASASATRGQVRGQGQGWQYSLGYQYDSSLGGISAQQLSRTAGYGDASTAARDGFRLQRRARQINTHLNTSVGTFNLGWVDLRGAMNDRNRLAYASYSTSVQRNMFVSVTAGRTLETGDTQLRLQLTYLVGADSSAQVSMARAGGRNQAQASYQQSIPTDGGWGWNASQSITSERQSRYSQAAVQHRSRKLLAQAGVFGTPGAPSQWAGVAGSLGLMDGYGFAANRITDSFALVSTEGVPNVEVMYDHQPVGRTDDRGYLLVTDVTSYYNGRYALNTLEMPAEMHAPAMEKQVAVPRGMGAFVSLPVLKMRTATITLLDTQGRPLPPGSAVLHEQGQVPSVVGWDGVVYLTRLHPRNTLVVQPPGGGPACRAAFDEAAYAAARDLLVTCSTDKAAPGANDPEPAAAPGQRT